MVKFENEIKAYALRNAIEFGKADAGRILPKLFQHGLKKEEIKNVVEEIKKIVHDVNKLKAEERKKEFKSFEKFVKEREEKERELPELPNAGKKVVLRVAPFPSGTLHLGNAKTFILNSLYAEKYDGKLILVMDDTIGSAEKQIDKDSYELIEDALKWLGIKYSEVVYKSDRLKIYYEHAKKLIMKGKAYVCHCSRELLGKNREEGRECGCRQLPVKIQLLRWKDMFGEKEGDAVLRIKTDMMHPNPAFRDRVLFRISDREHPLVGKKYRVWPSLEMSWAIDDHLLGVTHIIRGNDLMIESDMERFIWDIFSWKHPEIIHTGLVNIEGAKISKSKAQKEVKSGKYFGWNDPRTWSIQSLGWRGIKAEAIREFVKEIGLNKQDITIPIENLYAINRRLIDADALRYSFVANPVKLEILKKPDWKKVEMPVHPDKSEKREIKLGEIYISADDYKKFSGEEIRLLHLYNIKLGRKIKFTSIDDKTPPKVNWVSDFVHARILMPSGDFIEGLADSAVAGLSGTDMIQFERFGFVSFHGTKKIDGKADGKEVFEFWFAHR